MMQVSIVIVSYKVQYLLQQCIQSVLEASANIKTEIIVVDNNSDDGSYEYLQRKFQEVQFIENKQNLGFSKANNQGVSIANGTYVLILNPDTVIAEDTLVKLLNFADEKVNLGIVGVKLIDGTGRFLLESKRGIPTPMVSFNKLFGISKKQSSKYYAKHLGEDETGKVPILVGAFMFMKRAVYEGVKGFDEDYFMYGEDIDLSYKVWKRGYENYYFSDTQVIHYKGESTQRNVKYLNYFLGAMKIFYKKHFKLNPFFYLLMELGRGSWYLSKYIKNSYQSDQKEIKSFNSLLLTNNKELPKAFEKINCRVETNLEISTAELATMIEDEEVDELIFDNDVLTNKKIIQHMQLLQKKPVVFKIKPKNAHFIIGSVGERFKCEVLFLKVHSSNDGSSF